MSKNREYRHIRVKETSVEQFPEIVKLVNGTQREQLVKVCSPGPATTGNIHYGNMVDFCIEYTRANLEAHAHISRFISQDS